VAVGVVAVAVAIVGGAPGPVVVAGVAVNAIQVASKRFEVGVFHLSLLVTPKASNRSKT
jgi:hypothetical protein